MKQGIYYLLILFLHTNVACQTEKSNVEHALNHDHHKHFQLNKELVAIKALGVELMFEYLPKTKFNHEFGFGHIAEIVRIFDYEDHSLKDEFFTRKFDKKGRLIYSEVARQKVGVLDYSNYKYNAQDQLIQEDRYVLKVGLESQTFYEYDPDGFLKRHYIKDGQGKSRWDYNFIYDGQQLVKEGDGQNSGKSIVQYQWDEQTRLVNVTWRVDNEVTADYKYKYDDQEKSLTIKNTRNIGRYTKYSFDRENRIHKEEDYRQDILNCTYYYTYIKEKVSERKTVWKNEEETLLWTFDRFENPLKIAHIKNYENKFPNEFSNYEYDIHNNWIKRKHIKDGLIVIERRKIKYAP